MLLQAAGPGGGGQSSGRPPEAAADASQHPGVTWTAHTNREGRIYYCNHVTRVAGWLPTAEHWAAAAEAEGCHTLPYGWEQAVDAHGKPYFINHVNKTTTYEAPMLESWSTEEVATPSPRHVKLTRSPTLGFGFVAGSEKPVIVRFVTEDSPSVDKLLPGDEILSVNGEDVRESPREKVIAMVRSSETAVELVVCQPMRSNYTATLGRKSTLLSAGKRARLKARPSRVRFAESVCVNGAPLFPPSAFSLGEMCAPPMANVLKVFLENGQTKSFKYDANTTVQDVVSSLHSKLCLNATEHFSLVVEHIKSLRRNKLTLLDPQDTLARIAARPGAHKLRCLFRVSFVPVNAAGLAQRDPAALDYLFAQCCNDVAAERFAPELQPEAALRLAALHMHQHALVNNMPPQKLTVKSIEREFGLERFVPPSLLESMKRKEVRRLVAHFLRSYSSLGAPGQYGGGKSLTPLQAKLLYLDLVSQLPSYGAKCFSAGPPRIATPTDCLERVLLVSPRFGLSQIASGHNSVPVPIARLEDMRAIDVKREDDINCSVVIVLTSDRSLHVSLEERDACELALVLQGYHRVLTGKLLPVEREREPPTEDLAPPYLAQHNVVPAKWSYADFETLPLQRAMFMSTPKYHTGGHNTHTHHQSNGYDTIKPANAVIDFVKPLNGALINVDNNMNSQMSNKNQIIDYNGAQNMGYDLQSVVSMEILESGIVEARNEEVIKRVQEMQQLVENSEQYLTEQEQNKTQNGGYWLETNLDIESDSDSQMSGMDDAPGPLKHSDSLLLLAQSQKMEAVNDHLDLSGLADALQSESDTESLSTPTSSPIHYMNNKSVRTSFGLHSPDNNCKNEQDLKEYLRQLRQHAQLDNESEINSLEASLDIYDLDPDIIDLTLLPPPQTPDELDDLANISSALNIPPSSFADSPTTFSQFNKNTVPLHTQNSNYKSERFKVCAVDNSTVDTSNIFHSMNGTVYVRDNALNLDNVDFDEFIASVTVQPPTQQITPAVELTPEEILSYIIPPPPSERPSLCPSSSPSSSTSSMSQKSDIQVFQKQGDLKRRNSSSNVHNNSSLTPSSNHTIDYSTVDRKGAFSCCGKSKTKPDTSYQKTENDIQPPPRNSVTDVKPPDRPPKTNLTGRQRSNSCSIEAPPPLLPPRDSNGPPNVPAHILLPPKKPPLPPVPSIELRNKTKSPAPILKNRTAGIGSPHLQRNHYKDIEDEIESPQSVILFAHDKKPIPEPKKAVSTPTSPHLGRNAKLSSVAMDSSELNGCNTNKPSSGTVPNRHEITRKNSLGATGSPQIFTEHRRTNSSDSQTLLSGCKFSAVPENASGANHSHIRSCSETKAHFSPRIRETLLTKSDVALAGLLVRLDQVAAQCSAAQAHGGGRQMCEERFQIARDELTSQSLQLVTCSKCVVVAMASPTSRDFPEHLAACLAILRRLTELSQDLTAHTTAPLQTRNLVLKVHGVTAAFRDLVNATLAHTSTGQLEEKLAQHAECLANVLATLLRSLRVFSP